MKKVILIYFFVVMTMLFTGCKSGNIIDVQTNEEIQNKANYITDYKVNIKEDIAYNENGEPFKVKYAQISDSGNEILENQINKTLKSSITDWINKDCDWMEKCIIKIEHKDCKYISLSYTREEKSPRGEDFMSTFMRFGITVDMQTGKRVFLDDLFKGTSSLKQKLEQYIYKGETSPSIDSDYADKIIYQTSISEKKYFEEKYKTDSYEYKYLYSYLRFKSSFYLTDKQLVITIDENEYDDLYFDLNLVI